MNNSTKQSHKENYRTFEIEGQKVLVDDFIYRRLFKDPDALPHRKYTFIHGIYLVNNCPRLILKTRKSIFLSRYIMHAGKGDFVDHINRNRLDNRRCNLRIVNYRQNSLNRRLKSNTGLIGVSYFKSIVRGCFNAKNGKRLFFRAIDTPFNRILSALARDKFVLQEGEEEYAPLNFPCWKNEPLRSILMKEDLSCFKERKKGVKGEKSKKRKLNQQILRFCRKRAKKLKI